MIFSSYFKFFLRFPKVCQSFLFLFSFGSFFLQSMYMISTLCNVLRKKGMKTRHVNKTRTDKQCLKSETADQLLYIKCSPNCISKITILDLITFYVSNCDIFWFVFLYYYYHYFFIIVIIID